MASMMPLLARIPAPHFGTAALALSWGAKKATALPRYAAWAVPGAVGALWFVWPAVDDDWKMSVGIMANPNAEADAKAEAAAEVSSTAPSVAELSQEAKDAIANAHKAGTEETLSAEETAVVANVKAGDFSDLEKDWDAFAEKAIRPGEDDDDDDDDDEDDEDDDDDDDDDE